MLRLLTRSSRPVAPHGLFGLLLLILTVGLPAPAAAQTVSLQNGGSVTVSNGGTWDLHGTTVDLGDTGSTAAIHETSGGYFAGGTLTATRMLDAPSAAIPAGLGITVSTSANLGDVTVTRGHTVQTAPNGNESIQRYYDLSPSQTNSDLDAELTLSYSDAELNGRTESDLEFFKSSDGGASWSEKGQDSRDATANTVTLGGIESLSRWTLASESAPLPVELASFEATRTQAHDGGAEAVQLTWTTAAEQNNAGFEVQRRAEETDSWQRVGFRESTAAGGTTTQAQNYRFTDEALPYAADTLAYRLRQVDTDGSATLTEPVMVGNRGPNQLQLLGTYPNPVRQRATVRYGIPKLIDSENVRITLYDVLGRRVRSIPVAAEAGRHEQSLDLSGVSSGVYVLRLTGGGEAVTRKVTVVR